MGGRALLATLAVLCGCGSAQTRVRLEISAPSTPVRELMLDVLVDGVGAGSFAVPADGSAPSLPGSVVVVLPEAEAEVSLTLHARLVDDRTIDRTTHTRSVMHETVTVSIDLSENLPDPDLGIDLGSDAAGPNDLAMDLSTDGAVDLKPPDMTLPPDMVCAGYCPAFRRVISVTNNASTTLPVGFTIRVPMGSLLTTLVPTKLRADFRDAHVRVNTTEFDRLIDATPPGSDGPAIYFALKAGIASGVTSTAHVLYYADVNAPLPPSNGKVIFPLYDDFTGPIVSPWTSSGTPTSSGGLLVLKGNTGDALSADPAVTGLGTRGIIEISMRISSISGAADANGFYWWYGFQDALTFNQPWILWIARAANTFGVEIKGTAGCASCIPAVLAQDTVAKRYRIERDGVQTRFYVGGNLSQQYADTDTSVLGVRISCYEQSAELQATFVRGRATVSPGPTVTVGPELAN